MPPPVGIDSILENADVTCKCSFTPQIKRLRDRSISTLMSFISFCTESRLKRCKEILHVLSGYFVVAKLFNIAVNDFNAKKSARVTGVRNN